MKISKFKQDLLVAFVGVAFGGLLLYWGTSAPALDERYSNEGKSVVAEVTGFGTSTGGTATARTSTSVVYYDFELPSGQLISGSSPGYSGKRKGQPIKVHYLPSEPTENRVFGSLAIKPNYAKPLRIAGMVIIGMGLYLSLIHI